MSWAAKVKARRFAMDGQLRALVVDIKQQAGEVPAAQRAIEQHRLHLEEVVRHAPHDCDLTFESRGSFDSDGFGTSTVRITILAHEDDRTEEEKAAAAAVPEPV